MAKPGNVYIGIGGYALAIDRYTGEELWRTRLKGDFVNIVMLDGDLFASGAGELFCLDPSTGAVRWSNPLKGLGRGLVSIAVPGGQTLLPLQKQKRDEEAAAAAAAAAGGAG